jgi:hypothetical protein
MPSLGRKNSGEWSGVGDVIGVRESLAESEKSAVAGCVTCSLRTPSHCAHSRTI